MFNIRDSVEKAVIVSLFGDWTDNPFEISELKEIIENFDVELLRHKHHKLLIRALKKLNSSPDFEGSVPDSTAVLAFVELNAPKVLEAIKIAWLEALEQTPLGVESLKYYIKLLQEYKLKDEIRSIE